MELESKLRIYYITAIFSVIFAIVGFSYNAWRLEVTEDNSNIRAASFRVLSELAELEQIIYALHYDKDSKEGSPRKGWVKVGLIVDLSSLISHASEKKAKKLKDLWNNSWSVIENSNEASMLLIEEIDSVRNEIKFTLNELK
jgi:hypothetical protein